MNILEPRKWYKKKRYIISLALAGIIVIIALSVNSSQPSFSLENGVVTQEKSTKTFNTSPIIKKQPTVTPIPEAKIPLSNDNYYKNIDGNKVHSPVYSDNVPIGASAKCRDGTYSFSQNRRGTCSHHGGVSVWY